MTRILLPLLLLIPLASLLFAMEDKTSLEKLRKETHKAIQSGKWSKAKRRISAISKLDPIKHKEECDELKDWIKTRKKLVALQKQWLRKKLSSQAYNSLLRAFQKQSKSVKLLQPEIANLIDLLEQKMLRIINNFEGEGSHTIGQDNKIVESPVHEGKKAMAWSKAIKNKLTWSVFVDNEDWSKDTALSFWCYSEKPLQQFEIRVMEGNKAHKSGVRLGKVGWNKVRLILHGKKSDFALKPGAKWVGISSIEFYSYMGAGFSVVIDDIILEKYVKRGS